MRFHLVALNIHDASFATQHFHIVWQKLKEEAKNVTKLCTTHTYNIILLQTHKIYTSFCNLMCHSQIAKSFPPFRQYKQVILLAVFVVVVVIVVLASLSLSLSQLLKLKQHANHVCFFLFPSVCIFANVSNNLTCFYLFD